jgi:hypothetical protein
MQKNRHIFYASDATTKLSINHNVYSKKGYKDQYDRNVLQIMPPASSLYFSSMIFLYKITKMNIEKLYIKIIIILVQQRKQCVIYFLF